jgi:acyl carrier protein
MSAGRSARAVASVRRALARRLADPAEAESVAGDADLFDLGLLRSISLFDLIVDLEREFGVRIPAGRLEPSRLRTLNGIAETFLAESSARSRPGA